MKTTTTTTTTQKQINEVASWYNKEYANIYGCLRAMLCDDAPTEAKTMLRKLGLRTKKDVDNVARLVIENQPIIALDSDNNIIAMERAKKRTTTSVETIEKPITRWTFKKILNCIRVIEGTKKQITL
jgi:hypothetical protein